jgi:hypothetical protein
VVTATVAAEAVATAAAVNGLNKYRLNISYGQQTFFIMDIGRSVMNTRCYIWKATLAGNHGPQTTYSLSDYIFWKKYSLLQ